MGRLWRIGRALGVAAALAAMTGSPDALAQVGALGGTAGPTLVAPPVATGQPDVFARADRGTEALPVGGWLVYPTFYSGLLYDTNVFQTARRAVSSPGLELVPSLLAESNDGIHKTTLYGMADGRAYFNGNANNADTAAARLGAIETFQPLPDLIATGQLDYTRQQDLFSTLGIDHSLTTLNPTAIGLAPTTNPASYNQLTASARAQKNFASAFVSLGGSLLGDIYDKPATPVAPSPNNTILTGAARGGLWLVPDLYAYTELDFDRRLFDVSTFNSSGYRALAGLGSDQIGLFRGEVYAGYQAESFDFAPLGTTGGAVWGGRLYYYPLPELNLSAAVDQLIGVSQLAGSAATPLGASTKVTTALAQATYALAPEWATSGRAGYIHTDYVSSPRRDDAWTVGTTFTYSVWRNLGLAFDYQHVGMTSNTALQSFSRDVFTLGLTYKY